jgi:hypothetical protein
MSLRLNSLALQANGSYDLEVGAWALVLEGLERVCVA